jgi:putative zinc finger/helix-turn-helix YgiT family protein
MKCLSCGGKTTTRKESHRYTESGLPNVLLLGIDVARCAACGEYEITIPAMDGLHRAIAHALVEKPGRLTHDEIRFLRKHMGLSAADFARLIDASPATVSRWERGSQPMGGMAERLLRLMVVTREPIADYSLEDLARPAEPGQRDASLRLKPGRSGWSLAAA